ncbi:MAG: baseplate J/gp47 family protein [Pseudomonadota bacterium]|jgi:phage-related baseplate assembly protein
MSAAAPLRLLEDDPQAISAELVRAFEAASGKTLYPAQVERLFVDLIAYRETLLRGLINDVARQNLVAYARAPMLDYLGELVGVARLEGEGDERLRERIRLAPEAFSTAGPRLGYRHAALSASVHIIDAAVDSPAPGWVRIHPLADTGLPSAELLDAVLAAASAEDVRPLCDQVEVRAPLDMPQRIEAELTLWRRADAAATLALAQAALERYCTELASALGRDVVRSQIIAALSVPGVYRVELVAPNADTATPAHAWAHVTQRSLRMAGVSDG